jgi:predicted Zn-dependent protease
MDEEKMEKLAVLGYMAARPDSGEAASSKRGADPKDKIQAANAVLRINNMLQNGDPQTRCITSPPEIKKAVARFPDIAMLHFFLGSCYLDNKNFAAAVPELRQVVKLEPGFTKAELNLARALMHTEEFDAATTAFEHVAKSEPGIVLAHIYLIVLYGKSDRYQDQIAQCQEVLKVLPLNFGANLNLGRALLATGNAQGAIAPLQKASEGEPKRPGPHATLAEVYERLGRPEDADRERAEAERLSAAMNGATSADPGVNQFKPE